jgi:ADP-ribose pyrophosphatase YjhB (NUDIX family)
VVQQNCTACGHVHFRGAKPCVGALVIQNGRVLLARRRVDPFKDWWDVPGGFLEPWEHPAEGAVRELCEEAGLQIAPRELLGVYVDTYGEDADYTLNVVYLADVIEGDPKPADDVVELRWFEPDELPDRIAFDNGRRALKDWRARLQRGT